MIMVSHHALQLHSLWECILASYYPSWSKPLFSTIPELEKQIAMTAFTYGRRHDIPFRIFVYGSVETRIRPSAASERSPSLR